MRRFRPTTIAVLATSAAICGIATLIWFVWAGPVPQPIPAVLVAHAGGGFAGETYSNSLEALDRNYTNGHRLFEIDLNWTTDEHLVLVHDWDNSFKKWFAAAGVQPSLKEFKTLKMKSDLTQMTLEDLYTWLRDHKYAYIVTDVKERNLAALRVIARTAGGLKRHFIPQIYHFSELGPVRGLGFENVIFTVYRSRATPDQVLSFGTTNDLFAITMPRKWALSFSLPQGLKRRGVFVYAHTVNSLDVWRDLRAAGVSGIYTDFLTPAEVGRTTVERLNR
jgi:glycerophosphoryl diester phosphodiesterase